MNVRLLAAISLVSTALLGACNGPAPTGSASAPTDAVDTSTQAVTVTARDVAALPAGAELRLPLSPSILYTFDAEDGPIAFERIRLGHGADAVKMENVVGAMAEHAGVSPVGYQPGTFTFEPQARGAVDDPSEQQGQLHVAMCAGFAECNCKGGGIYYYYPCWVYDGG